MAIKNVCVFCSSSNHLDQRYIAEARNLGNYLVENNFRLIYGGTNVGLMGIVANAVKEKGGEVWGVIPKLIDDKGIANRECDKLIVTGDLRERKRVMFEKSDAFVALPGGFGTLEEMFEVITLKQLQYKNPPIVFLNTLNFYNKLESFLENIFEQRFTSKKYRNLYYIAHDIESLSDYFQYYKEETLTDKWTDTHPEL
jgi:cytokinin riboside 5'-monophosphate phosphoribohydrolase